MDVRQSNAPELQLPEQELPQLNLRVGRLIHFVVTTVGVGLALVISITALWGKISSPPATASNSATSAAFSDRDLDFERPQKQAVILLERAVSRSDEMDQTEAQIEARVDAWRGNLKWDSQLADLTTIALNSRDQRLRSSAVEIQLAAYGLPKSESSVNALVRQAGSRDHAKKIWALWMLGLLGNRGVETDHVVQVLTAQLKDSGKDFATNNNKDADEDVRRWAVQGLALVGTTPTIAPLLDAMHNDPSSAVRERAASSLAQSAMLSQDQRLIAVPQLINYSGDPALDAPTHALAFQALAAITKQHLPNDSATWRNWYQTSEVSGQ
jgi:HEAT repeat protein